MEPTNKLDEKLLRFLSSTPKPALVSVIIQTLNGLKEEDKGLIYSRGGEITENLRIINSYTAQLPADLAVVESIAIEPRVTHIWLHSPSANRGMLNLDIEDGTVDFGPIPRVLICTVKGLTEEQKSFILSQGGKLLVEFSSIKSYIANLPSSVMRDLVRSNLELTIIHSIPDELSIDDLMKCAKTGSREELKKEIQGKKGLEKIYG